MSDKDTPVSPKPLLGLKQMALLIIDLARWSVLRELAKGEPLPVYEQARWAGRTPDAPTKHVKVLRRLGVVETGWGCRACF